MVLQDCISKQLATEGIHIRWDRILQNTSRRNINLRGFSQIYIKTDAIKADKECAEEAD